MQPQSLLTEPPVLKGSDDPINCNLPSVLAANGGPRMYSAHPSCAGVEPLVNSRLQNELVGYDAHDLLVKLKQGSTNVQTSQFVEVPPHFDNVEQIEDVQVFNLSLDGGIQNVGEGVSSSGVSSDSQVVNEALSQFRSDCMSQTQVVHSDDDYLSVTGSNVTMEPSLTPSERNELEMLREIVQRMSQLSMDPSVGGQQLQNAQNVGGFSQVQNLSGSLPQQPIATQNVSSVQDLQNVHGIGGFGSFAQPPLAHSPIPQNVQSSFSFPSLSQNVSHVVQPVQQRVQPLQQRGVQQGGQQRGVGEGVGAGAGGMHSPSLAPRNVELQKPSIFNGRKVEVDNFIFEMRQYCDSVNLTGGNAVRFAVSHFKQDALTWWRSLAKDGVRIFEEIDLEDLLEALKKQFSDIDEEMKLRDRILSIKQRGGVTEYVTEFKMLQLRLGSARLNDDVALHVFLVGLKNFTRQQVMLQRPETLEDAILLSERAEQSLYWSGGSRGQTRTYYGDRPRQVDRSMLPNRVSQYSNSKYKGPAPMVLGNVSRNVGGSAVVTCYHCGKVGHYARSCPDNKRGFGGQKRGGFVQRDGQQKRGFNGQKHVHNVSQVASSSQQFYPPPPQQKPKQSKN